MPPKKKPWNYYEKYYNLLQFNFRIFNFRGITIFEFLSWFPSTAKISRITEYCFWYGSFKHVLGWPCSETPARCEKRVTKQYCTCKHSWTTLLPKCSFAGELTCMCFGNKVVSCVFAREYCFVTLFSQWAGVLLQGHSRTCLREPCHQQHSCPYIAHVCEVAIQETAWDGIRLNSGAWSRWCSQQWNAGSRWEQSNKAVLHLQTHIWTTLLPKHSLIHYLRKWRKGQCCELGKGQ